jgi:hypothetical protein
MNEVRDYDEDTEEVVLSRWGKIKQWIEIIVATKKVAMVVWSLIFATGGAVVVGQATDTQPIRDAAVSMGLLDERPTDIIGNDAIYDELSNLIEDVERLEEEVASLSHVHAPPIRGVDGRDGEDGKEGARGPEGPQGIQGDKGRPGQDGNLIVDYQIDQLFDDHVDLLH